MSKILSQDEIDNLIRIFKEPENENNDINKDFVIELLNDKLVFLENKKIELLVTIERDYEPQIDSLKRAISILQQTNGENK
ncbi:MAG: hypothetical protein FWD71_06215 [Oscillospiraceae bacterium]|nr:hypothetical protein [Oscillospiraceae bacterium]